MLYPAELRALKPLLAKHNYFLRLLSMLLDNQWPKMADYLILLPQSGHLLEQTFPLDLGIPLWYCIRLSFY